VKSRALSAVRYLLDGPWWWEAAHGQRLHEKGADRSRRRTKKPRRGDALGLGELTLLPNRQLDMVAKSAVTIGDLGAPCDKMRATDVATRARSALGLVSHGGIAMAEQSESLHIDVDFHNEEIEVTLPPTNYSVTFIKSGDDEVLIANHAMMMPALR
jgi:hypothetical protein